ncbi:hypothetical protein NECAME_07284 [Necator americanus]|uniref:Uncharacterized protein n=1 Tax=Necator americanus TaxID=51031 RepID=W2TPS0_NECAM|nr:hypothetical protein NECAME_07284 [Necator americanus]ETN83679.1 hypothetical protein NECAME_07284 [Necator americanus]
MVFTLQIAKSSMYYENPGKSHESLSAFDVILWFDLFIEQKLFDSQLIYSLNDDYGDSGIEVGAVEVLTANRTVVSVASNGTAVPSLLASRTMSRPSISC